MAIRQEIILIVDDDQDVLDVTISELRAIGYRAHGTTSTADALAIIRVLQVDLLCTDIVMPETDGRAFAQRARQLQPGLKVLYMTGFIHIARAAERDGASWPLLLKPWRSRQLEVAIRGMLYGPSPV